MTQQRNSAGPLGPSFMSQVRRYNPDASRLDMRKIIGAHEMKDAFKDDDGMRDRLPETLGRDYPSDVTSPQPLVDIDPSQYDKPVAVIGAGAAGLCAGYELMRMGLRPVYFESQTLPNKTARPGGRAYSYDFADALKLDKKTVGEMGCMRFPKNHTTLRAYVDNVFGGDYKYADPNASTKWHEFIDPLLYEGKGEIPQDEWTVKYDTMLMARGVNNRKPLRIPKGTSFSQIDPAVKDVATAFGELLFADPDGILTPIVKAYAAGDTQQITEIWANLNAKYQEKSIFEALRDEEWDKHVIGDDGTSRLELFGELGIGSGGFDAFWGTTFMEVLRIKLHEDESEQRAFVGGTSYMLKPFLTHETNVAGGEKHTMKYLTDGHVITSPVISINAAEGGGVVITCEDNSRYTFPIVVLTASPTAISSSIMIEESLLSVMTWKGVRRMPLTGCGKIFLAFPKPFWKSEPSQGADSIVTTVTDYNIRQVYTFDDYHWGSGSPAGVLMLSYTWGDWAHKLGSLPAKNQVESALRMLKAIYESEWTDEWDDYFTTAINDNAYRTISWSHERGFAGGYRMADLNRYPEQHAMSQSNKTPANSQAAVLLAGEATAWLGLSGWVEGALQTGIDAACGVGSWFKKSGKEFGNWDNMTKLEDIKGTDFTPPTDPGSHPVYSESV